MDDSSRSKWVQRLTGSELQKVMFAVSEVDKLCDNRFKLIYWMTQHVNDEGAVVDNSGKFVNQNDIAQLTGISIQTVSRIMGVLQTCDPPIIHQVIHGIYRINPLFLNDNRNEGCMRDAKPLRH